MTKNTNRRDSDTLTNWDLHAKQVAEIRTGARRLGGVVTFDAFRAAVIRSLRRDHGLSVREMFYAMADHPVGVRGSFGTSTVPAFVAECLAGAKGPRPARYGRGA